MIIMSKVPSIQMITKFQLKPKQMLTFSHPFTVSSACVCVCVIGCAGHLHAHDLPAPHHTLHELSCGGEGEEDQVLTPHDGHEGLCFLVRTDQ